ncbi:MAG: hypothetical protein CM15mP49_13360 [Actinomycetota bacterium]|nr:MAG: hypothetical protein CM15mP49_13360 [Actinomycetota bacterium]
MVATWIAQWTAPEVGDGKIMGSGRSSSKIRTAGNTSALTMGFAYKELST